MIWTTQYSSNVTVKKPFFGEALIKFPTRDGVHYLVREAGHLTKSISATFEIKPANADFVSADGGFPRMRLYFQRKGDNMSGEGSMQFYRWWSNPFSCILRPGKQTLTVPLQPGQWSSVYGRPGTTNPIAFRDACNETAYVGMTFGGNFFGHGVWAKTEGAKFKLISFKI